MHHSSPEYPQWAAVCLGAKDIWELYVLSTQSLCEPKTALEIKPFFLKQGLLTESIYRNPTGSIIFNGKMLDALQISSKTRMSTINVSFQRDKKIIIIGKKERKSHYSHTWKSV